MRAVEGPRLLLRQEGDLPFTLINEALLIPCATSRNEQGVCKEKKKSSLPSSLPRRCSTKAGNAEVGIWSNFLPKTSLLEIPLLVYYRGRGRGNGKTVKNWLRLSDDSSKKVKVSMGRGQRFEALWRMRKRVIASSSLTALLCLGDFALHSR